MSAAHTPGPWYWVGDSLESDGDYVLGVGDDGRSFGMHSAVLIESSFATRAEANRHLIAAAPELFEHLEALLAMCERQTDFNDDGDGCMFERARAAIAKATGGAA